MKKINKIRKQPYFILCICVSLILTVMQFVLGARFSGSEFIIGNLSIPINSLNGIIQTISFIFCILMVFTSPKRGIWAASIIIGLQFTGAIRAVLMSKNAQSLPGVFNCLLFLIALIIIYTQFVISERRAVTDEVTGISNGLAFENAIYRSIRHNERGYLIFIHLDGLFPIIANHGREVGDKILKNMAERLQENVKDKSKVFRLDGAEYAVLLPADVDADEKAREVLCAIEKPVEILKNDIITNCYLTASIGISPYLNNDLSAENLIKRADIAMNYAIKAAKEKVCIFNDTMKEQMEKETAIEGLIKDGLENDYFYLVYQPQYTAVDKRLRGFETLIRMANPNGGNVPPGEFISVAEKSELILDIDDYVLRRAMKEFREICYASGNTITVAINVSATDIAREGFADKLLKIVDEVKFPAECLEIEITEYSFADTVNHTIDNICKLRDHQIMIALDDFGTGYTSLEQLMKLPVNLLKLDKSLVDNVAIKKLNTDFVKSIIYMGHLMDTEVIAEGVENEAQLEMLRDLDCDFTQGYLWGRPMEYDQARSLAVGFFE